MNKHRSTVFVKSLGTRMFYARRKSEADEISKQFRNEISRYQLEQMERAA